MFHVNHVQVLIHVLPVQMLSVNLSMECVSSVSSHVQIVIHLMTVLNVWLDLVYSMVDVQAAVQLELIQ